MKKYTSKLLIKVIGLYQIVSSYFPQRCNYYPTCSQYTKEAVFKYGAIKGLIIGMKRIIRCHPFRDGGFDPLV